MEKSGKNQGTIGFFDTGDSALHLRVMRKLR